MLICTGQQSGGKDFGNSHGSENGGARRTLDRLWHRAHRQRERRQHRRRHDAVVAKSPATDTVFERDILPQLTRALHGLFCDLSYEDREDAVADSIAQAWILFRGLPSAGYQAIGKAMDSQRLAERIYRQYQAGIRLTHIV